MWRQAADELVAYVQVTYAPLGIVLSGSLVRGDGGPTSDLDVFVIHDRAWRLREQRRFRGVPAELFVNPPAQIRRYFASGHAAGKPDTAHMLATGELVEPAAPIVHELVREAHDWLAKPLAPSDLDLAALRYAVVDTLDDARDVADPAMQQLLLARVVSDTLAYVFWRHRRFQPRRKELLAAVGALEPATAELAARWAAQPTLAAAEQLARHVLGVDTFFEWTSATDPVMLDS